MAWSVVYDESAKTIVTTFTGVSGKNDLMSAYQKRVEIAAKTGATRLLIDTRECLTDIFIATDMYTLVEKMYEEGDIKRDWRIAVLQSNHSSTKKMVEFYSTVTLNRGWNVKEFIDQGEAYNWLASVE